MPVTGVSSPNKLIGNCALGRITMSPVKFWLNVFSIPDFVPSKTAFAITKTAIEKAIKRIITQELLREMIFLNAKFSVNIGYTL